MRLPLLYTLPMISLTVNNKLYNVDVAPDMPLLWVIRDVIGLTGTKFGCGLGVSSVPGFANIREGPEREQDDSKGGLCGDA